MRNVYRWCGNPGKGAVGSVEDEGRHGRHCYRRLRTAGTSSLPFLVRPRLLCGSLQGPGLLCCLCGVAVAHTFSRVLLLPQNWFLGMAYLPTSLLPSETNVKAFCFVRIIQILLE